MEKEIIRVEHLKAVARLKVMVRLEALRTKVRMVHLIQRIAATVNLT